jgi:L-alanine-DL-glutamate epimerase-like enolase superfamily enzyme
VTTELQVRRRTLRMRQGMMTARGLFTGVDGFWLRFGDGLGEVTLVPGFGVETPETARAALAASASVLRDGARSTSPEEVGERLQQIPELIHAPASRAGLELAMLDDAARAKNLLLMRFLGSEPRPVRLNALLTDDEADALASEARARVKEGYGTLKIKVGGQSASQDAARLVAVRSAVGPNIRLRIDGNAGWSETEARSRLEAVASQRIEYCEQPVAAEAIDALRRLRSVARVAADESVGLLGSADMLLGGARPAVDVLVFKLPVVGGILRARRLAGQARDVGVEVAVTSAFDGAVSRAGAAHLACVLPADGPAHGLATGHLLVDDPGGYAIAHGQVHFPDSPGLGIPPEVLGW